MADRYWVGGTATWDNAAGTKWAATSGGAGGQSVPTSADDVYFDAASGTVTVTLNSVSTYNCRSIICTGFTGTITGSGGGNIFGGLTLSTTMTWSGSAQLLFAASSGSWSIDTAGKTVPAVTFDGAGGTWTLSSALTLSGAITVNRGTFTTNNYNVTVTSLSSSSSNTRTINLGSSTVSVTSTVGFNTSTNLTFNSGTSQINLSAANAVLHGGVGQTFYNVTFTSTAGSTPAINGANAFNNLSVAGRTSAGVAALSINADQTINGTLTLSAGTNATCRTFVRSDTIGTTRTLTCAAVTAPTDIDFRDITIAGAAAPVSGTRLGDCKGNSGITFDAAKTVYWRLAASSNWSATTWALSPVGLTADANFPLAQDTAVFNSGASLNSGQTATINAAYNIGTIDMSARTSNTMTLATGGNIPQVYGNWINGTGTTLTGSSSIAFTGRASQTITTAGKTFAQAITIDTPGGSVTLQDALTSSFTGSAMIILRGTIDANGYNVTLSAATANINVNNSNVRTVAIGAGTWTVAGSGNVWNATTSTNLTVTGTGTISLTSASGRNFIGGGIQTYPTINQGGTGTLTITGSNKFANITNTAIGRVQFVGATTNEFTAFNLNGVAGNLLQIGTNGATVVTLKKPTAWNVGANSTDAGNNTGLSFTAGGNDYLSISYVNGVVTAAPTSSVYYGATNVTAIYYGSTPVTAIYYGSTQVF